MYSDVNPVKTNNFAINVGSVANKAKLCPLCIVNDLNVDHCLRYCKAFPTPLEKVNKLKSMKYCTKCSFRNHETDKCRFKFGSPCKKCSGSHLTYLCLESSHSRKDVISKLSAVHFSSALENDDIVLPTFTLNVKEGNTSLECKVLNDTGSQRNFISERVASELRLPIKRSNVDIVIHGFNSSKNMKTKVVEFDTDIDGKICKIEAIVIPDINLKINAPKLTAVKNKLTVLGYNVADKTLGDNNDIDIVMGPDAIRLLSPSTISLSNDPDSSILLSTKLGIMILGSIERMEEELDSLNAIDAMNDGLKLQDISNDNHCNVDVLKVEDRINECDDLHDCRNSKVYTNSVSDVLDDNCAIIENKLSTATNEALEQQTEAVLHCDNMNDFETNQLDDRIVQYILSNTDRSNNGRLIMPLPWNPDCMHLLGNNYFLSKNILFSNLKKSKKNNVLNMYNDVFKEQEELGIIERIDDVDTFRSQHPECSFLPHMGVIRMNNETTKVRIVYLANLCEKTQGSQRSVSHNNAMLPGPCLNNKISTSLLFSRFDKYICIFDIKKAFLNIELKEGDQEKLLCLWFRDIENEDYSLIAFKNVRLGFGLRPSPFILMLALHKILELDTEGDDDETVRLKKLIYANIYMDNGVISAECENKLMEYYNKISGIFNNYKFDLQQFASNSPLLQKDIGKNEEDDDDNMKLLGTRWNLTHDTLSPLPIKLDIEADTKRSILSSFNAIYDIFNVYAPLLNRARLFFHKLQCEKDLAWDAKLKPEMLHEWRKICKEVNKTPIITLDRYVGPRNGNYDLVAFCDSSSVIYGVVLYIIDRDSRRVSFLLSKNRVINSDLAKKSIPSLECQGLCFAIEAITESKNELCGSKCVLPINIVDMYVYTDSMVALSWVRGYFCNFDKMQKRSIFIQNRLRNMAELLRADRVTVRFIEGHENPADCVTRPFSYSKLSKTRYFDGPSFLTDIMKQPDLEVIIPFQSGEEKCNVLSVNTTDYNYDDIIDIKRYSSFTKATKVVYYVLKFINRLKKSVNKSTVESCNELNLLAMNYIVRSEQHRSFPDIIAALRSASNKGKIPNLVLQLNLYLDEYSIIRVKGKFKDKNFHPMLLYSNSHLTEIIVTDIHKNFMHSSTYVVLRELRKRFWIVKGFSAVRNILKKCVNCTRVNARPIKLNQNSYREFRTDPPKAAFSSIFVDYIGPINVKIRGCTKKVWLLIVTCLWSRAVSLKVCYSADTREFLRALQTHIYEFGLFKSLLSDLGSQITAGINVVSEFLEHPDCAEFLRDNSIDKISFDQYPKGNSSLGSIVECLVKQVKSLITKSIGKLIMELPDFQLLITKTQHIINRRPVAFKEVLQNSDEEDVLSPITPEMLIYGRELVSMDLIPHAEQGDEGFNEMRLSWQFKKLSKANSKLVELYSTEFLRNLMIQAVDKKERYKPVVHKSISPGDLVLLVEANTKRSNYPLGIVQSVTRNALNEVTSALIRKGRTRETVFRHSSSLIPILTDVDYQDDHVTSMDEVNEGAEIPANVVDRQQRPAARSAAIEARREIQNIFSDEHL